MYFAKLLLTCRHALAQSMQRYARGKRKGGRTYTVPTDEEGGGSSAIEGREAFMDDG